MKNKDLVERLQKEAWLLGNNIHIDILRSLAISKDSPLDWACKNQKFVEIIEKAIGKSVDEFSEKANTIEPLELHFTPTAPEIVIGAVEKTPTKKKAN